MINQLKASHGINVSLKKIFQVDNLAEFSLEVERAKAELGNDIFVGEI